MKESTEWIKDIKNGNYKPLYFLMGDESFYIDQITDLLEQNVLSEDEKGFNQFIVYGKDISIEEIISMARQFPMIGNRTLVIVKEAQHLSRNIEKVASYLTSIQSSTVLAFAYKGKSLDKRKALHKALKKQGFVLETKKLYDNQLPQWIGDRAKELGLNFNMKATFLMTESIGNDLSRIDNELVKLKLGVKDQVDIDEVLIEKYIGISKDYNNFELLKAIGSKDRKKVYEILYNFSKNPKDNPLVMTLSLLYNFFSNLMLFHVSENKNPQHLAKQLKVNPYFLKDYELAARNFPLKKVSRIISALRKADLKSKGVEAHQLSDLDISKDLMIAILH